MSTDDMAPKHRRARKKYLSFMGTQQITHRQRNIGPKPESSCLSIGTLMHTFRSFIGTGAFGLIRLSLRCLGISLQRSRRKD